MMYADKFVVAIKAGGKILRETKDLVHLPFGSEFSVLVKNLNSRRAKFTLHIDGTDVLDGEEIIVGANAEVEMKRFIRNGNMDSGNAFKFIERTKSIEDGPRGIKMDDGVVRVEFWFEKQADVVVTTTHHHHDVWWDDYYRTRRTFYSYPYNGPYYGSLTNTISTTKLGGIAGNAADESGGGTARGMTGEVKTSGMKMKGIASNAAQAAINSVFSASASGSAVSGTNASYNSATFGTPTMDSFTTEAKMEVDVNEAGITVQGSKVDQKFTPVYGFKAEEISNVIIIRMAGKISRDYVLQGFIADWNSPENTVIVKPLLQLKDIVKNAINDMWELQTHDRKFLIRGSTTDIMSYIDRVDENILEPITVKTKNICSTCSYLNKSNAKFCSECGTSLTLV